MPSLVHKARKQLVRAEAALPALTVAARRDFSRYRSNPSAYVRDILRVKNVTPQQERIFSAAVTAPYNVDVPSGHDVGKTWTGGCLVNWWYDCFDPGICLTTAPTLRQVTSLLWKEVRLLRARAGLGGFDGPKAARMSSAPDHFAEGFTARDAARFQGYHDAAVMVLFDEAEGIDEQFWQAADTMLGGERYCFLKFYNPIVQAGPTVDSERSGQTTVVRMSCLDHPNIKVELRNEAEGRNDPVPVPNAIRLNRLREMLRKWSDSLGDEDEKLPTDVELAAGEWYRPKGVAQCRLLGIRPTSAFDEVWSDALWQAVLTNRVTLNPNWPLQIGCDVAWYGDDYTSIHVRQGMCSLWHESHNGWSPSQTAGRLKQLSHRFCGKVNPRTVPVLVDLVGMGASVMSHAADYSFHAIDVTLASENEDYPNLRSQLWFDAAEIAKDARRLMDVSRLDADSLASIGRQLVGVKYHIDSAGRMVVEDKDDTKKRLGRSPDDADAFNLAWLPFTPALERVIGNVN